MVRETMYQNRIHIKSSLEKIPKSLRQSLLVIAGNGFTQGISAIAIILITRLLGPSKFGEFSVGFSILLLLNRINDLGMTAVVQKFGSREKDRSIINRIFSQTTQTKLIGSIITAGLGTITYLWIAQLIQFHEPRIILFAFLLNPIVVLYEHLLAMLQALHRFSQTVFANFIQSTAKLLGTIILFLNHRDSSVIALVLFSAIPSIPVLLNKLFFPRWISINLRQKLFSYSVAHKSLALHSATAFLTAGIIENIDVLFVQAFMNSYEAGLLGGITRIALLFNLVAYSLANVLNPRVARYTRQDDISAYLKKAWLLVIACIFGFFALWPFTGHLISLTIGSAYQSGSFSLLILLAAAFLSIASIPFIALFDSIDAPWYFSISGILQLLIIILGNFVFVPMYGLEGAVWTRLIARVALFVFTLGATFVAIKKHIRTQKSYS